MSKLSVTEQSGCKKLLKLLSEDDLLALKDTVTNRMIVVESAEGKEPLLKTRSISDPQKCKVCRL